MNDKRKGGTIMIDPRRIQAIDHHRNGVGGAPFSVVQFRDVEGRSMFAVVFEAEGHVAVFDIDKAARGDFEFGSNSWRGDQYEPELRVALAEKEAKEMGAQVPAEVEPCDCGALNVPKGATVSWNRERHSSGSCCAVGVHRGRTVTIPFDSKRGQS